MEMGTGYIFAFLVIGALLVFVDGWLLRRSGTTYLEAVYADGKVADSVNQLITVLFHLTALGILALIATIPMSGNPFQAVIARLGVMLLVLAAAHGITIAMLGRLRSRQQEKALREEMTTRGSGHVDAKPEAGPA